MSSKRANAARAFLETKFSADTLSGLELSRLLAHYPQDDRYQFRIPTEGEKLNSIYDDEIAIPIDHFYYGWHFPIFPEMELILSYYGIVPAQISPNSVASIIALIVYFREEGIEFSLKVFRKLFYVRAQKEGTLFFGTQKLKIVNAANKNPLWWEKFVFVKGDFGNLLTAPVKKSEQVFKEPKVEDTEKRIVKFLKDARLDVTYYAQRARMASQINADECKYPIIPVGYPLMSMCGYYL